VSLLLLDLDGVLYDFAPERRLDHLAQLSARDPASIHAAIWGSDFERAAEAGAYTSGADYLRAFNERLGMELTLAQWIDARVAAMTPRPRMLATVESLRARIPVAVLTNNGMLVRETLPQLVPELWALLGERIHVTAEFCARKPDPRVFERVASAYGCRPETVLFVDDDEENVQGARLAGLQAYLFEGEEHLARWLPSRVA
jgi:putative hydrolase of the HAD superfamily